MLFSDERKHKISIPDVDHKGHPATIAFLIQWLCDNLMKDPRKDMFVLDDSVYSFHESDLANAPTDTK